MARHGQLCAAVKGSSLGRFKRSDRPSDVFREDAVRRVLGVLDPETATLNHRLEKPGEGRVLITDVFFKLRPAPVTLDVTTARRAPSFEAILCFSWVKVIDDVPQPEHAPWSNDAPKSMEGHSFPKVGQMMERVTRIDEVSLPTSVFVAEETGLDDFDVIIMQYPET